MDVVELLPHDQAVLDALGTVKATGFGVAPPGALEAVRAQTGDDYFVLYPIDDVRAGSMSDEDDIDLTYQVTIVAKAAAGARDLVHQAETALKLVTIPGRTVLGVHPAGGGGVRADRETAPVVFIATPRFQLWTASAT